MAEHLRFHPLVISDLSDAIEWYERISMGLGNRFRAAVDARFDDILESPDLFPKAFDDLDIRFVDIRPFPYLVIYRVQKNTVFILGVFHSASNPARWRLRTTDV